MPDIPDASHRLPMNFQFSLLIQLQGHSSMGVLVSRPAAGVQAQTGGQVRPGGTRRRTRRTGGAVHCWTRLPLQVA